MEWTGRSRGGLVRGLTAVALTSAGAIAQATVVYDGFLLKPAERASLVTASTTP